MLFEGAADRGSQERLDNLDDVLVYEATTDNGALCQQLRGRMAQQGEESGSGLIASGIVLRCPEAGHTIAPAFLCCIEDEPGAFPMDNLRSTTLPVDVHLQADGAYSHGNRQLHEDHLAALGERPTEWCRFLGRPADPETAHNILTVLVF